MRTALFILGACCIVASGCTVVSENRVFPKLSWYWSDDAKTQRDYNRKHEADVKAYKESLSKTNK
jgi:hypothetical protein